ncbi:transcriptional regulator with XRE-family HTH domain [Nocardioides sp. J9]|uniref:helix-turn-helix transcriptional regulator n=1 Tax=unclassified Nocardioides TaxID=2615069 RepID=UPI0004B9BC36|nr:MULTISPECIES: helix-turn-helix transcriptional regulator [unclassified Nocardioides]TWG95610.1 transcriptional regulator with XRE-family HTH domain [Nocardioides sp. J9]
MNASAGVLIREWRQRRHLSQLELASRADVSTRHLSYIETGKARPTSAMVMRLCDFLEVPLREQNQVLVAAGHAPAHPELRLTDPPMAEANAALEAILRGHLPFPALVVDRHWDLVTANDAAFALLDGVPPELLEPPVNVIRVSVHPDGLAPRIENLEEWRAHLAVRLRREYDASGDELLRELHDEVVGDGVPDVDSSALVVPLRLRVSDDLVLSLMSTTTVFGTPREVTLSELAIEAFYPADDPTRDYLTARS